MFIYLLGLFITLLGCFLSSDPWKTHFPIKENQIFSHAATVLDKIPSDTEFIAEMHSHMQVAYLTCVIAVSRVWGFQRGELVI